MEMADFSSKRRDGHSNDTTFVVGHGHAHTHAHTENGAHTHSSGRPELRLDVGHTRIKADNADLYMTPQLKHRFYNPDPHPGGEDGEGAGRERSEHGGSTHLPTLTKMTTACYSVGHFLNDATASCWFSYLLLYLEQVQKLDGLESGIVLFSGQLFDALATPVVGILSDKSKGLACLRLGRRKLWNFIGVVIVVICFFFVFGFCLPCAFETPTHAVNTTVKTAVFALFASLFNIGWASVQVSHMAMVPELTHDEGERVFLNSLRYAFTILANVLVFVLMWIILHFMNGGSENNKYAPETYSLLTYSVLAAGGMLSLMFLVGTREAVLADDEPAYQALAEKETVPTASEAASVATHASVNGQDTNGSQTAARLRNVVDGQPNGTPEQASPRSTSLNKGPGVGLNIQRKDVMTWRDWFYLLDFYKVASVYMFTRLAVNVSQVYLSFFITETLQMDQTAIAVVPLLVYISSLIATTAMKRISNVLGRRNSMTIGGILFAAACVFMLFLRDHSASLIYVAALLLGSGSAITMVISVSLEADLVGRNVESAAFLYGAISFTDKLSNGIAVLAIQYIGDGVSDGSKGDFIRYVNALVPLVAIGLAVILAWTIKFPAHLNGSMAAKPATKDSPPQTATGKLRRFMKQASTFSSLKARESSEDSSTALLADGRTHADERARASSYSGP